MDTALEVLVPLLNPNEPDARVVAVHAQNGQRIEAGQALCSLETTKSAAEVVADHSGYLAGLSAAPGDVLAAGARLCWIAPDAEWRPPAVADGDPEATAARRAGLRITEPALALAHKHSIDLGSLPLGPLITVSSLQSLLEVDDAPAEAPPGPYPEEGLIVYGGGGHGKSLIELIRAHGAYEILGVIDDGIQPGSMVLGVKVLGSAALLPRLVEAGLRWGVNAVGGVGDITSRVEVFTRLESAGLACPALVHPRATVEASAQLGDGVQIFPHAYVGSASSVGYGVIVNTQAVVSHDCVLADYANIAPGALLAGGVIIGERVLIGMGVTINLNVTVGARARVGNSAVVKTDVPPGAVVHAGAVWPE